MQGSPAILIVEDARITAEDLRITLESLHYTVTAITSSYTDTLKEIQTNPPHLILMDISLKGPLNGIAIYERIQAYADIPVIYLTAHSDTETLQQAQATAPLGFILKPFKPLELRSTIELALHKHTLDQQLQLNKALLHTTLAGITDAVVTCTTHGKITFMNQSAERLAQCSLLEAKDRLFSRVFPLISEITKQRITDPACQLIEELTTLRQDDLLLIDAHNTKIPVTIKGNRITLHNETSGSVITLHDETEKHLSRQALVVAAQNWQTTFDSINDAICMLTLDGVVMKCNQAALLLAHTSEEEIIGSNCRTTLCAGCVPASECLLTKIKKSNERESTVAQIRGIWYRIFIDPVFDNSHNLIGAIHTFSDITPMKLIENELRAKEEKYRELVENANSIILRVAPDNTITFFNEYAETFFGYSSQEILGKSVLETIVPPSDTEGNDMELLITAIVRNPEKFATNENENIKKDGTRVWIAWTNRIITNRHGDITGLLSIGNDITPRRRAEKERLDMEQQLLQAQKMEAIGILAGGIAHDFNNILTAIQGHNDLAISKVEDTHPVYRFLQQIHLAADRAFEVTSQLLLFSRKSTLESQPVNLNNIMSGLQNMLERLIGAHYTITLNLHQKLWPVFADKSTIEQVLMNLTLNARDAMPDGGTIAITTKNTIIDAAYCEQYSEAQQGRYVHTTITDTGLGMDEASLQHLFEPFFTTKSAGKGTGLGLSVAYGIIHQHQGWFTVQSMPQKGTTFHFYIPAIEDIPIVLSEPTPAPAPSHSGSGERILVIEDSKGILDFITQALQESQYTIFTAQSSAEAIHVFGKENGDFHMVLTDIVLPDSSGIKLAQLLEERDPNLPIAFMSGYTDSHQEETITQRNARFLQKPFTLEKLLTLVKEVLKND